MSHKVAFVELPVFAGVVPLASGYMEAYCRTDPELVSAYRFEKISMTVKTPYRDVLTALERADADVYAFSCYVWNSAQMRRLLAALKASKPNAHFVLGGPQVMHQAAKYLSPQDENVFVCNGEGERTFSTFLRTLLSPEPDFASVRNLSFYREGNLLTTAPEERISDLSEIPSPFLEGVFEKYKYTWMLLETNRGCPFKCNYCFWGAATGARVYKYDEERVQRELEWISQSGCLYLFIADANWGMLKRDVDLTRHLVECHKRSGSPTSVFFCGSKNTPERVAEISRIFHDAGMIAAQSVALQTMNPTTLKLVNRDNIRTSTYTQMQESLNQQGVASYVEMIWPLPGETLSSFQQGLSKLCELGADCFMVYPLLLMNNVELCGKQQEYGLITVRDPDPNSEAEIVVQTAHVSADDFDDGARYFYAVTALYSLRGLWSLGRYLSDRGVMDYATLFCRFIEFWRKAPHHPFTTFCEDSIRTMEHIHFSNTGGLIHKVLHAERELFDDFLAEFVKTQSFWNDEGAQFFFEVDLINRPYIYRNTPIVPKRHAFAHLKVLATLADGYQVELPATYGGQFRHYFNLSAAGPDAGGRYTVSHRRAQLPFMPKKSLHEHLIYCQDMAHRMKTLVPVWTESAPAASLMMA